MEGVRRTEGKLLGVDRLMWANLYGQNVNHE